MAWITRHRVATQSVVMVVLLVLLAHTFPAISQTKWFKYEGNPVLDVGPPGAWDDRLVNINRVIFRDSIYQLWYSGWGSGRDRIGYAISRDGVHWTKHPSNPVLNATPDSWDQRESVLGYVISNNSNYEMWYTGADGRTYGHLGYATSRNGTQWTKNAAPVISNGPWRWNGGSIAAPSVLGPDSQGSYRMWFVGFDADFKHTEIGYAAGTDATHWTKSAEPVLRVGSPESWDGNRVQNPRVLDNGNTLEMWYAGTKTDLRRVQTGYATSSDGIHWTKNADNPVLKAGPIESWDDESTFVGDVIFDGQMYWMWYTGSDGSTVRSGLAVSPAGCKITLSASSGYVIPHSGAVRVAVQVDNPKGLAFEAIINTPVRIEYRPEISPFGLRQYDRLQLFDDGAHGDSLAEDGLYANTWSPREEKVYFVDLKVRSERRKSLTFEMKDAAVFTSVGPIQSESFHMIDDGTPNPGDTILVRLALRNLGASATASSVTVLLSSPDSLVTALSDTPLEYGDILPGAVVTTPEYFRLFINPNCPADTDVRTNISISSAGFLLWADSFTFRVKAPWWTSTWAYAVYLVLLLASVGGTIRYVEVRKLKRRIEQLEHERALERERTRISQDMHDEVGARLTEIGILSELAKEGVNDPRQTEMQIKKISETSREVIASISEIIWAINARNDSLDDLVAYLREYASKYLGTTAIKCTFEIPDEVPTLHLSAEARRNIFLVVKESLHNIVKHSRASEVQMRISLLSHNIEITIEDNGHGFDAEQPSRFGNGLRNMEKRMNDIGGTFEIVSRAGRGTTVTVRVRYLTPDS